MNELESNEIHTLAYLVIKSTDVLVAYKNLLSDAEKLDLQDSARKLERLFHGEHPRYNHNQCQPSSNSNNEGA